MQTLDLSHFSEVAIHPWNEDQEVVIQCLLNSNLDITELNISSLHFTSCTLQFGIDTSVDIANCVFRDRKREHAVTISGASLQISNCTFASNFGAIGTEQSVNDDTVSIDITDTLFQDNGRVDTGIIDEGGRCIVR